MSKNEHGVWTSGQLGVQEPAVKQWKQRLNTMWKQRLASEKSEGIIRDPLAKNGSQSLPAWAPVVPRFRFGGTGVGAGPNTFVSEVQLDP